MIWVCVLCASVVHRSTRICSDGFSLSLRWEPTAATGNTGSNGIFRTCGTVAPVGPERGLILRRCEESAPILAQKGCFVPLVPFLLTH